jgi:hypothetical protein
MSCPETPSAPQAYEESSCVIYGEITKIESHSIRRFFQIYIGNLLGKEYSDRDNAIEMKIRVLKAWKGCCEQVVTLTADHDLLPAFQEGEKWLFYVQAQYPNQPDIALCTRQAPARQAAEDMKLLGMPSYVN